MVTRKGIWLSVVLLMLAATAGGVSWYRIQTAEEPEEHQNLAYNIAILGDSLAEGVGASSPSATLEAQLTGLAQGTAFDSYVESFGKSGAVVEDILEHQVSPALIRSPNRIIVIAGTNDIFVQTPPEVFRDKINQLLDRLVRSDREVIVFSLPKLIETPVVPVTLKGSVDAETKKFNAIISDALKGRDKVTLFDFYTFSEREFARQSNLLADDRFHPNDTGYRLMAEAVYELL